MLLLLSLSCWILFTLPIGYLQPPARNCLKDYNTTRILTLPTHSFLSPNNPKDKDVSEIEAYDSSSFVISMPVEDIGKSPIKIVTNQTKDNLISPWFSSVVYKSEVSINLVNALNIGIRYLEASNYDYYNSS